MKKLLKISALALTMAALLFSCANPSSSSSEDKKSEGSIDSLPELSIKDISIPKGFTPTSGAVPVTTAEQAEKVLKAIDSNFFTISESLKTNRLNAIKAKDPDFITNLEKQENFYDTTDEGSITVEAKPGNYSYSFKEGTSSLDINNYKNFFEIKKVDGLKTTNQVDSCDVKESVSVPSNTGLIKSYVKAIRKNYSGGKRAFNGQEANMIDYDNASSRQMFIFDDPAEKLNGIVIITEDSSVNYKELMPLVKENKEISELIGQNNLTPEKQKILNDFLNEHMKGSKKVIFYDLEGKETFKYKDIKTYTEYMSDMSNK